MKVIEKNPDNLTLNDVDEIILRARAVMINNNNELLIGYLDNTYQFPGGHVEKGESVVDGLIREIEEETGIVLEKKDYKPFIQIQSYYKEYEDTGKSRYVEFNYFLIRTEEKFDLEKRKLDDYEIENKYSIEYIKLDEFDNYLERTINDHPRNKVVYSEIREVLKELYNIL